MGLGGEVLNSRGLFGPDGWLAGSHSDEDVHPHVVELLVDLAALIDVRESYQPKVRSGFRWNGWAGNVTTLPKGQTNAFQPKNRRCCIYRYGVAIIVPSFIIPIFG